MPELEADFGARTELLRAPSRQLREVDGGEGSFSPMSATSASNRTDAMGWSACAPTPSTW